MVHPDWWPGNKDTHAKQELQGLKSEGNTNQNLPKRMTFLDSLV